MQLFLVLKSEDHSLCLVLQGLRDNMIYINPKILPLSARVGSLQILHFSQNIPQMLTV
jgi:hypothetical protein